MAGDTSESGGVGRAKGSPRSTDNSGRTVALDDIDMYVETRGRGTPLLLLHGFTGSGADWRHVFKATPRGFRVIAPDLRGHGRSTNPKAQFTFRQSALDVFALLDRLGIDGFHAIGMSAGAKTLLHMATRQPGRIEAMVLVSAAPYFPKEARPFMAQITAEGRTGEDWQVMRRRHKLGDEQIRALWRQGNAFKDSYDDMAFTPPHLEAIKARTLIVHGDRDPFYPVRIPLQMYESIPGSCLWIVPGGGHGPIFGDMRACFVETASAFLRGEWRGGAPG